MSSFATTQDIIILGGRSLTAEETVRAEALLEVASDELRLRAKKVGKDLDEMITEEPLYENAVKEVVVFATLRTLNQNPTGEAMSQESQGAGGYTWSGTYAIPGGGVSFMNRELDKLGLRSGQKMRVIEYEQDPRYYSLPLGKNEDGD